VLLAGADAAMLGTRFLMTEEARVPRRDAGRLAKATGERLLLDTRLVGPWPCAARRRLVPRPDVDRPSLFAGLGVERIDRIEPAAQVVKRIVADLPRHLA